ncbi:MAG: hypothetical protein KKH67_15875 [candidate division Zixibacteria bacterium]|nr:hypothetical protein [candidate division Zixibacteria bacterium]MBU1470747.1 hypothetical protein [candidate division Zixibacteria bacterium]
MTDPEFTQIDSRLRRDRAEAREMLESDDVESLTAWAERDPKLLRVLVSLLYDRDELVCFRAADALGRASAIVARRKLSRIRNLLRRLFWTMNDESGSICWYAPEAIGEILANVPVLISEYSKMLFSFLKEEPFEKGVHRALHRIAGLHPGSFALPVSALSKSLDDPDPSIRGHAILTIASMGYEIPSDGLDRLRRDDSPFRHFNSEKREFETRIISEVVREIAKSP